MRNLQFWCVDELVGVKQNIQVNEPGTFGNRFVAANAGFDGAQGVQQSQRLQIGFTFHYAIEEPGLVEKVDGLGFINRGNFAEGYAGVRKGGDGGAQIGLAVSNIGS